MGRPLCSDSAGPIPLIAEGVLFLPVIAVLMPFQPQVSLWDK